MFASPDGEMRHVRRDLRPATEDELEDALVFAMRFDGRKRVHQGGDQLITQIAAELLVAHLEWSGFVVMKKAPVKS
jgi:hypothetical protein